MEDPASGTDGGNEQDPRWSARTEEEALPKRRPNNYRPEPLEQTWAGQGISSLSVFKIKKLERVIQLP